MKIREEQRVIRADDGKSIYVTIGMPNRKPKGMVVLIHGLTSTELWPTMLLGSWYFRRRGFAYCRINLYDWRPNARTLMTSDLLQHSKDTDCVVRFLKRKGFKKIFAVGHSFGGLTILQAKTSAFSAISLWDISSFIKYPPKSWYRKIKGSSISYMIGAYEVVMSKRYQRGIATFPDELKLISGIKVPTQVCYAAGKDGPLIDSSKRYFDHLKCTKKLVGIVNASHSFTEEGTAEKLFLQTKRWFEKF